ncbi:hypothetical protein D2Q93_02250 [Alicyclobacillaceae bacterium I2511]|nr:hypothetical protein D2Q93_02250 [Alicyclobacillaceae bacterium I2511]
MKWPWGWHKESKEISDLVEKLDQLLVLMAQWNDDTMGNRVHITVEHLQVEKATLEQLTFRLGQLDIKELSGTLSIGNNFATPISSQKEEKAEPSQSKAEPGQSKDKQSQSKDEPGQGKPKPGQSADSQPPRVHKNGGFLQNTDCGLRLRWDVD